MHRLQDGRRHVRKLLESRPCEHIALEKTHTQGAQCRGFRDRFDAFGDLRTTSCNADPTSVTAQTFTSVNRTAFLDAQFSNQRCA